ncbi:DNA-directed RNA polymerase subunit P [archaeon]|nr:DNA-directed RNA polymerase subunit P [archaeon]
MYYKCLRCGAIVEASCVYRYAGTIRCPECGGRVLEKMRTLIRIIDAE